MVVGAVLLWRAGPVQCIAVHHLGADSYEVQIVVLGRVFLRRWFDHNDDAAWFAAELGVEFGAVAVDAPSVRLSIEQTG